MKRKGFSLITAIIFIVLVATIGALALSLSTQTSKQTSDVYMRVQAELLLRSATEYALLALSAHEINAANGCINNINIAYPSDTTKLFDANITLRYIGSGLPTTGCTILSNNVATEDSNVTVVMDTIVTSANSVTTEPIRIHKRTLQKL